MDKPDALCQHFFCVSCGTRLKARASKAGKQLPCPKCGTALVVPRAGELTTPADDATGGDIYGIRAAEEEQRPMLSPHEHSGPVRPAAGNDAVENGAVEKGAEGNGEGRSGLKRVPSVRPMPPRWPLVRGVFSFLPDPGAVVCWSMLSFMGTLLFSMLLASFFLGQIPTPGTRLGSLLFLVMSFLVGLLFVLTNAICCLAILQESAAGNCMIEDWPSLALLDHLGEAFIFINSMLITVAAAWAVTYPLAGFEPLREFCEAGCFVVLFPVVLLSMLEAGSCLVPVSTALFHTIRRSWRTWLVFYVESFVLAFGLLGYIVLLGILLPWFADYFNVEITMPMFLLAVALGVGPGILFEMIYFRLIGRLAWVCDEDSRRELGEEEAAEEGAGKRPETTDIRPPPVDDF